MTEKLLKMTIFSTFKSSGHVIQPFFSEQRSGSNLNIHSRLNVWTMNMASYYFIIFLAYKINYITQNSTCTYRKKTENKIHKVQ